MSISNIDDLLMGGQSTQPIEQPATDSFEDNKETHEEEESSDYEIEEAPDETEELDDNDTEEEPEERLKKKSIDADEYGNEKEPENEAIRERLSRQAKKYQSEIDDLRTQLAQRGASEQVQQAAKDFEYDPDSSQDWQQQLASFVKQTVHSMTREQEENLRRHEEEKAQLNFRDRFVAGMNKFDDFLEVVDAHPIDIEMTMALRGMTDPAAFIYAAAKRHPQELERISKLRDPYARVLEIGRLEERMRKNKPTTKAPRPMERITENSVAKSVKKKSEPTGDDLLAQADAKRLANTRTRIKNNR